MDKLKELKKMYESQSKHSQYQLLSNDLSKILNISDISINSRYEKERLNFILEKVDLKNRKLLDIGGNTGYFSFEALSFGAKSVTYYEGNEKHANFVESAADLLAVQEKITIHKKYYDFVNSEKYDATLLLNVLHHIGDDFGDDKLSIERAKKEMISLLYRALESSKILIFQLGFNWKGDPKLPLFKEGTKEELIEFITKGLNHNYKIEIGIAEKIDNQIIYKNLNKKNIRRNDSLGEFLNRPIFIIRGI
ncbi:class I SAM-dependent methyltransferase [Francisella sp. 19X1-34]|uniref:class I SAM-dependent methyltransferase n=1 Tax=Francisella sp. 19X1-34 TaxID=3087177 RepID=UPI002E36B5B5|nr:class I SAM-dependent methyltransferase [Francisella sp. 19X1-34]MED7788019.1 class I SAM-dependent methyltransferase [Francisella sp. 19X1-34]